MEMSVPHSFSARVVQRLRRETRLLGFVTALAFLAGFVMYLRYDVTVRGMPLPLFTGLVYAGFVGTAATVVSLILPALRAMIEAAAISRLGVALAAYGMPEFGLKLAMSPLLSATFVVLGAIVVRKLFCFETLARWSVLSHETECSAGNGSAAVQAG